jgi:hypothetical protein
VNISAQNTFTIPVQKNAYEGYSMSVSGTFVGTVTAQRSKTKDGPWFDIYSTTISAELDGDFATPFWVRAGFKTGGYTSGTAVVDVY